MALSLHYESCPREADFCPTVSTFLAPMGDLAVARAKYDDSAIVMVNTDTSAHPSIGHLTIVVSTPLFWCKLGSVV